MGRVFSLLNCTKVSSILIFELNENGYRFIKLRNNNPSCNAEEPDEARHADTMKVFSDCEGVLVARIGPGAEQRLLRQGIKALVIFLRFHTGRTNQNPGYFKRPDHCNRPRR